MRQVRTHGPGSGDVHLGKAVAQALDEIESQLESPPWYHRLLGPSSSLTTISPPIHLLRLPIQLPVLVPVYDS